MVDSKTHDKQEIPEIVQKARQIIARDDYENATLKSRILRPGLTEEYQLAKGVVEFYEQATRMLDAEQERLLLASEDEIRKEIIADGRDPDEYLKAMDTVMKVTGENAILKHDLEKALANHSADLSARGENTAADFAAQLAAVRSYEALHWAATWIETSGQHDEAVRSFAKNMAMTIRAEANSRHPYVGEKS